MSGRLPPGKFDGVVEDGLHVRPLEVDRGVGVDRALFFLHSKI